MKKKKFSLGMPLVYLLLIVWALTTIYPLIWVVMNSFKDKKQIVSNSFALPFGGLFTLDNYEKAINKFRNHLHLLYKINCYRRFYGDYPH